MKKIALCGRLHSGKDTTARALKDAMRLEPFALAGPLKDHCSLVTGIPRECFDDQARKELPVANIFNAKVSIGQGQIVTLRNLMQREGQAARAVHGDDVWIRAALRAMSDASDLSLGAGVPLAGIVVTDVRRWNELTALRSAGFKIVRLNRADRIERHDFESFEYGGVVSTRDQCSHIYEGLDGLPGKTCDLPRTSHPTSWSEDRNVTEIELPDDNPFPTNPHYDAVFEGASAEETATNVLAWALKEFA